MISSCHGPFLLWGGGGGGGGVCREGRLCERQENGIIIKKNNDGSQWFHVSGCRHVSTQITSSTMSTSIQSASTIFL